MKKLCTDTKGFLNISINRVYDTIFLDSRQEMKKAAARGRRCDYFLRKDLQSVH